MRSVDPRHRRSEWRPAEPRDTSRTVTRSRIPGNQLRSGSSTAERGGPGLCRSANQKRKAGLRSQPGPATRRYPRPPPAYSRPKSPATSSNTAGYSPSSAAAGRRRTSRHRRPARHSLVREFQKRRHHHIPRSATTPSSNVRVGKQGKLVKRGEAAVMWNLPGTLAESRSIPSTEQRVELVPAHVTFELL